MTSVSKKIQRKAYDNLLNWKSDPLRKPLMVRGARQVGKTTLIREFSKEYTSYIELNLEKKADQDLFLLDDVKTIFSAACLLKNVQPDEMNTLIFIDEIQESPRAIQLLRYFFEELPKIHVIAAGSLLEFSLKNVASFPVGRMNYLYLNPLDFEEFLNALNQNLAIEAFKSIPIQPFAHASLISLFHEYALIGGMPEIIDIYRESRNVLGLGKIYSALWQTYKDDVVKYARNETDKKVIRHVIEAAPFEQDRIKFEGFGKSNYRSREVGEALRSLDSAKIIQLIYPSTNLVPPIMSDLRKRPRLQFLDTGMLNQILNLQGEMIQLKDLNDLSRGRIIQHLVCQELIAKFLDVAYKPHFWVREEKDSNSEVDLVFQYQNYLIPIEVKSGPQGRLRSLHQFIERTNHSFGVRLYAGEFSIEEVKTAGGKPYYLMNMPYFLASKIPEYIAFLVDNRN